MFIYLLLTIFFIPVSICPRSSFYVPNIQNSWYSHLGKNKVFISYLSSFLYSLPPFLFISLVPPSYLHTYLLLFYHLWYFPSPDLLFHFSLLIVSTIHTTRKFSEHSSFLKFLSFFCIWECRLSNTILCQLSLNIQTKSWRTFEGDGVRWISSTPSYRILLWHGRTEGKKKS